MAAKAKALDIKNSLLTRARALGNTERGLKEVCSDLLNQHGITGADLSRLRTGTFLSDSTLKRMATLTDSETGRPYRPNADTCERVLRYFGAELRFDQVVISSRYANKPKAEAADE